MCGIFGYISNRVTTLNFVQKKINKLFCLSESRGKEAAGLAIYYDKKINVYKKNITAAKFIKTKRYKSFFENSFHHQQKISSNFAIIGHSRLVTNGASELNYNNQPVIKDGFVAVHNGIITNVAELFKKNDDLKRDFEIDTEIFLCLLKKYSDSANNLYQALKLIFNTIEGTASIAILSANYNNTILTTNNGSLYYYLDKTKNNLIFASEKNILKEYFLLANKQIQWIEPFSCMLIDNITLEVD